MINFKTIIKNIKSNKVIIIIILISIVIFLYFILKKKPIERFTQDLCLRDETEIKNFKKSFYSGNENITDKLNEKVVSVLDNNYIEIKVNEGRDDSFSINFKNYSIVINNNNVKNEGKNNSLISPTGILFDPNNDDIIVFDIYKLRRFQYRLNRTNFTNFSQNEYSLVEKEIFSENEIKRLKLFIQVYIYCSSDPKNIYTTQLKKLIGSNSILLDNYEKDDNTDIKIISIIEKINFDKKEENRDINSDLKLLFSNNNLQKVILILSTDEEAIYKTNLNDLKKNIKKDLNIFIKFRRQKICRDNFVYEDDRNSICTIKYQEDLPKYNLGKQGKGIESLNYDKAKKSPLFDNKLNPLSNSWNEPKYDGIFTPLQSYKDKRIKNSFITENGIEGNLLINQKLPEENNTNEIVLTDNTWDKKKFKNTENTNPNYLFENFITFSDNDPISENLKENLKLIPNVVSINLFNKENEETKNLSSGFFVLPDEFDAIGVKMLISNIKDFNYIFVPDVLNNRIQVLKMERGAEFNYAGQFGNLDYTTIRSLPTYRGEKSGNVLNPIKHTDIMYEPIHNMEIFEKSINTESPARCGKICEFNGDEYVGIFKNKDNLKKFFRSNDEITTEMTCYNELKKKLYGNGPDVIRLDPQNTYDQNVIDFYESRGVDALSPGISTNTSINLGSVNAQECATEYSTRRANIHNRRAQLNKSNELSYVKTGHFYSLYNEYHRVKNFLKRPNLKTSSYSNPFNLIDGAEVCAGKFEAGCKSKTKDPYNGIAECSIAYRKFLLKVIKETNEGQKFGQLFRPKSITIDEETKLYYVVDTYHHCIQCFKIKNLNDYKSGQKLEFESMDKNLNEQELFCYDKDWNYNKSYHGSPVYSLGLRQQILEKSKEQRKEDLNKKGGEYPNSGLKGEYLIPDSNIDDEWTQKYAEEDGKVKLYRWVSGTSKYANISYREQNINYKEIGKIKNGKRLNDDYFFYSSLTAETENKKLEVNEMEAKSLPGIGEFLYPSDIIYINKNISPVENTDLLMVADTGNNRVVIFKKYLMDLGLDDNFRFRFYRFLGDKEKDDNRKFLRNPISIAINKINGSVYVLEGNISEKQCIKVFYPVKEGNNGYYKYRFKFDLDSKVITDLESKSRITRIEIDARGFLMLSDIGLGKIHIISEIIGDPKLEMKQINQNILNKVIFKINYNPHKNINSIFNISNESYLSSYNRFRFIIQRFNFSTNGEPEILMSREYNHNYFDSIQNSYRDIFTFEDKYEKSDYLTGYWLMRFKNKEMLVDQAKPGNSVQIVTDSINLDVNLTNNLNKYNNLITDGIEEWKAKTMTPNTTYKYFFYLYNYTNMKSISNDNEPFEVHTSPIGIPSNQIKIKPNDNNLEFKINYSQISKLHDETAKYNPLCIYLLRRNHNRTKQGLKRYLNCYRHNMIQLLIPNDVKYIFTNASKPKFGKLYAFDITKAGNPIDMTKKDLLLPESKNKYLTDNYLLFYSAEGGFLDEDGKFLPTSQQVGMDYIVDFFSIGDNSNSPHTKIQYEIKIDIRQTKKESIMFNTNEYLESNILYYRKDRNINDESSLSLITKQSIPKLENSVYKNKSFNYIDNGIIIEGKKIPIPQNMTLEYNVIVGNQYKLNPQITNLYFTTRPEKAFIKSISKIDTIENGRSVSKLKLDWYYTQNQNLYWPVNFLILRLPKKTVNSNISLIKKELDFTKAEADKNDKFLNIEPSIITVKGSKKISVNKTFNLDINSQWKITFQAFNNNYNSKFKDIFINNEKFIWSEDKKFTTFTGKKINLQVELDGSKDEYLNKVIIEEYIDLEQGPSESNDILENIIERQSGLSSELRDKSKEDLMKAKEDYLQNVNSEYNDKLIRAVEEYRQRNEIGFYFNLQDDYNGYYKNVQDNYSGKSGQLLQYLLAQNMESLYSILNELHDKIIIYYGEANMTIDGASGMLRSGGKDALIDKIRHLSFMLKEATKTENKSLGIVCKDQDIGEIISTADGFQNALSCLSEEKDKKLKEANNKFIEPKDGPSISTNEVEDLIKNFDIERDRDINTENGRELEDIDLNTALIKFDKGGEWEKEGIKNIVFDTVKNKVKLVYDKIDENGENIIGSKDKIVIWRKGDKKSNNTESKSKSNLPYQILNGSSKPLQLSSFISDEDRDFIMKNYAIQPTPVKLSSLIDVKEKTIFGTEQNKNKKYSLHTHYLPYDIDQEYTYQIATFQNGHSLNSNLKKSYLGISYQYGLGFGEVLSDSFNVGQEIKHKKTNNESNINLPEEIEKPKEVLEPIIKYFEPKQGGENTMIRIVGSKLDELDYICFRDIRVKIIKKQKRILVENDKRVSYDEYLVKPPTLKELKRECWQSYEPYKVLVWGYFNGSGRQIRSSEGGNPENTMYKYMTREKCPDQVLRKYSPA